jgi:TonB family protein
MPHLLIRIFVAVVTFAVGIAASALWGLLTPSSPARTTAPIEKRVVVAHNEVATVAPRAAASSTVVSGGILNGKAVSKSAPEYPAIAKQARAEGRVVVRVLVDEHGGISSASAESGHPLLQQAAVNAVREWRFSPTLLSGQPVKVSGLVTVNFRLE